MAKRVEGNKAAERALLAGICKYGNQALVDIDDIIEPSTFSDTSNQVIYKCLKTTLEESDEVDEASILAAASRIGFYEVITKKEELDYLRGLFNFPIKLENVRVQAIRIKKLQVTKQLQLKLEDVHRQLSEVNGDETINEIMSIAEQGIFDFGNEVDESSDDQPTLLFDEAEEYLDHLIENKVDQVGIQTPFPYYDEAIGGGQRAGSVNLIVARPKTGKTTVAKTVGLYVSENYPVLMLDTEMNKNDQLNRSIASEANILSRDVETGKFGENDEKVTRAKEFIREKKNNEFYYKCIAGKPFDEVISIMRRWVMKDVGLDEQGKTRPCLIIYDYFKLMDASALGDMQEYQAMGFQISKLTDFVNLYGVSCLAFVQANRQGIEKESTDIISQSDRLLWLCGSCCFLRRKTHEEITQDGFENGNMRLVPLEARYGAGLADGDWINMNMQGDYARLTEINLASQMGTSSNGGFQLVDEDECPFDEDD